MKIWKNNRAFAHEQNEYKGKFNSNIDQLLYSDIARGGAIQFFDNHKAYHKFRH